MPITTPPALVSRDIRVGPFARGPVDGITDVRGVLVNHVTRVEGEDVRDGATGVLPNADPWRRKVAAATWVINGNGAMTNRDWIDASGYLETPVVLVGNTLDVGRAYDGVVEQMLGLHPQIGASDDVPLPVVAEVDGQRLDDVRKRAITAADVRRMLDGAHGGPFARGAVGAGLPATAFQYKGGIGSSSRVLPRDEGGYTVGVLVNANMEARSRLIVAGVPAGRLLPTSDLPARARQTGFVDRGRAADGSIIIVVATDAPLDPVVLRAVAERASAGLFRTGAVSRRSSGDLVLAFSTTRTTTVRPDGELAASPAVVPTERTVDDLYAACADATESAIYDALLSARTTSGNGSTVYALPKSRLEPLLPPYVGTGQTQGPSR